jgi:hypothetical protein
MSVCWTVGLLLAASAAPPAELPRLDRTIRKEPVYRSKKPLYCLVVFGREAKTRVWLVLDGDVLYADRNGDGDLTTPNERIEPRKEAGGLVFEVGDVEDGPHTHTRLTLVAAPATLLGGGALGEHPEYRRLLRADPAARLFLIQAHVVVPGLKGGQPGGRVLMTTSFADHKGLMQLADRPARAPVVHLGGPWRMTLFPDQALYPGAEQDLILGFGTPGRGPGTFAYCGYEGLVPAGANPEVQITFPPRLAGAKPLRRKWTLKERC